MFRKMIALILIFVMFVPLSSAAADEPSESRSMEDILNEYHRKAFEATNQGDTGTASTWSRRSGNEKTLEQETVDTLTAAGYEAYNVTGGNYDTLEAQLQTDFAAMGLDPEGSYIMVISGEDPAATEGTSTYDVSPLPEEDQAPDGGDASLFSYTYDGQIYWMRYVTIISADQVSGLTDGGTYTLDPTHWLERLAVNFWDALFVAYADGVASSFGSEVPLGSTLSLLIGSQIDENYTRLQPGTLTVHSCTDWTVSALQIWNGTEGEWKTAQVSTSAFSRFRCVGYVFDPTTGTSSWYEGSEISKTQDSHLFNNFTQRQIDAVLAYRGGSAPSYNKTGNINFYFAEPSGEIVFDGEGRPLFTHYEHWSFVS